MTRTTLFLDRIATLLVGLSLLGAGICGGLWWDGRLPGVPKRTDTAAARDLVDAQWWPWASGAAGVVLVLIGVRWLLGHLASPRIRELRLAGSGPHGKLRVESGAVLDAAADALALGAGIRSAHGRLERDRGQRVAHLVATVEPEADLAHITAHADDVSALLRQTLQRDDVAARVELRTARRGRAVRHID